MNETIIEPATFERLSNGLVKGLTYHTNDLNQINWFRMIPSKFLYILKDKEDQVAKKYGKSIKELELNTLDEKDVCVTLAGLRYLLNIRGYKSVHNKVDSVTYDPNYQIVAACTHTCTIEFIGNYETGGQSVTYSDSGGASLKSASSFMVPYLETLSANRAICRSIRGFLQISSPSREEIFDGGAIDLKPVEQNTPSRAHEPHAVLESKLKSMNVKTFDTFKKTYISKYKDTIKHGDPEKWTNYAEIHPLDIWTILGVLSESEKSKK